MTANLRIVFLKSHRLDKYCSGGFQPADAPRVLMSAVGTIRIYDLYRPNRRFFTLVLFCNNGLKSVATKSVDATRLLLLLTLMAMLPGMSV